MTTPQWESPSQHKQYQEKRRKEWPGNIVEQGMSSDHTITRSIRDILFPSQC